MAQVPVVGIVSHTRRVQSLYKRALRMTQSRYFKREIFRYEATMLRNRFDCNVGVKDLRVAKEMVEAGEKELFMTQHWSVVQFPESPGGVAFEREVIPADWIVDYWHPLEKAQYPEYFARRECRKKEYTQLWDKQYSKKSKEECD